MHSEQLPAERTDKSVEVTTKEEEEVAAEAVANRTESGSRNSEVSHIVPPMICMLTCFLCQQATRAKGLRDIKRARFAT